MDTLLLNSDAQPVSWMPLSLISWQEAIKYLVLEKAQVLEWYSSWVVRSVAWETQVPAVMMLHEYMKPKTSIRFSKANVFLRDQYTCAYCNTVLPHRACTLDHILPSSHGGKTSFENCVTACSPCNSKKGNNKKVVPKTRPHKPDFWELVNKKKNMKLNLKHNVWASYLK